MIKNIDKVIENVMVLGDYTEYNQKLELQIIAKINEALAYCYRKDIPCAMILPLAEVIVNELKADKLTMGVGGNVTSYREGDMSINFGSVSGANGTSARYGGKLEGFKQIIGAIECSEMTDAQ